MNTPVNFPLAKLLKEKGFDSVMKYHYPDLNENQEKFCLPTNWNKFVDMAGNSNYYSAPTIAEVIMWLYEKHGIWISVGGDNDYKFKFEINTWKYYEHEKSHRLGHTVLGESFWVTSSDPYNAPTEAYEAAIKYCLNNIINQ